MKNMDTNKGRALSTSKLYAFFSEDANTFTALVNKESGEDYIKTEPTFPLITLYGLKDKEKIELQPSKPIIEGNDDYLSVSYFSFSSFDIFVKLSIKAQDDKLILSCNIDNQSTLDVVEILMPHISGLYLGTNDKIVYPHHAGEITTNPVLEYGKNRKEFWRAASVPVDSYYRREINYCGLASMSWMYYYSKDNGIYIASHDPSYPVTGVIAETSGDEENPWMAFGFRKYERIRKGEQKTSKEYVIAISKEDWHYGARIYREYIAPFLSFAPSPEFLKDEVALNQCYNFKRTGNIDNRFKDIPMLYDKGAELGVRHMFIASWNRTGFDSFYPEYYPDMELGSAMEFRRGLEYVRDHGGFSTLYINARIFDKKSDFHPSVGEKMAMRNEKGETYDEEYGPEHFTVNCPSDSLWRDYLIDTAEFSYKAYGCDGIYLDQLASAEPFPCYAEGHSHKDIGDFNQGYLYVLSTLLERMRDYNKNAYLMTENIGDIYSSYTWANLTWNGADYDESYNVFKYTFPEKVQVNMVNPRSWEKEEDRQEWFYHDMHRAVSLGNILWMGITTKLRKEDGFFREYAEKMLAFRTELQPLLRDAEFLDDQWLEEVKPKCFGTCWNVSKDEGLILASSERDEDVVFRVNTERPISGISCIDVEGNTIEINQENKNSFSFSLKEHQMVRILFSYSK